jgi:crossover junction endodeoxyribonuclease RuvC
MIEVQGRREGAMASTVAESGSGQPARAVPGRVVGIDPGLGVTGYAVIEPSPRPASGLIGPPPLVVEAGVIRAKRDAALASRLDTIYQGILEVLDAFPPDALALEQVHSRPAHPRTAILMAHARGVIMLAAAQRGVPVIGYAASRIKKTLTGHGRAPKEQMQHAVRTELGLDRLPEPHDVADACAVALCHFQNERNHGALLRGPDG